jgi:hypothetical protein
MALENTGLGLVAIPVNFFDARITASQMTSQTGGN